jgi:ketosteroid isomerase-like protein
MTRRTDLPATVQTSSDDPRPLSRRGAVLAGLALPFASSAPAEAAPAAPELLGADVLRLVDRADRANAAFVRGDMNTWHRVAGPIADDFTLMQPFGGPASRGFDASPERLAAMARYFAGGNAELEVVETYASADLVVLVFVERQRGRVGGLPEQDWSLRVTQVYRRRGGAWELVHRHADPLVRNVGLERTATLARGD